MKHKNVKYQSHREKASADAAISGLGHDAGIAAPPTATRNDEKGGAQNETRENTMFGNNKDVRFLRRILGLTVVLAAAFLLMPDAALAQTACDNAIYPSAMTCTPSGDSVTLDNDSSSSGNRNGVIDLSAVTGSRTFNNNAEWRAGTANDFGAASINNAGTIQLDSGVSVSAPGGTYIGTGNGTLYLQAIVLDGQSQLDCAAPTVTGCLDLRDGSTSGQTSVFVAAIKFNPEPFSVALDKPLNRGVVIVDVGGGTSHAGDFVLDPESFASIDRDPGQGRDFEDIIAYAEDPVYGAVLNTGGLFDYALLYSPNTQQHVLTSVPDREGVEYVSFINQAMSIWHTTADAVVGRQADLRAGGKRGGWLRLVGEDAQRDAAPTLSTWGNSFTYDQSYSLYTGAAIAGYDLVAGDDRVFGVHLGLVQSRSTFEGSETRDNTRGAMAGVYGGWWNDQGLTLDGTINANLLDLEHDVRTGLEDSKTNIVSFGARGEAGWRMPLSEGFYVQPLATAVYARANIEELDLRDYDASFKDANSTRAGLGVRLGGDAAVNDNGILGYWLTARAWEEFSDKGNVQFAVEGGDPLVIKDDLSGSFQEVNVGLKASNKEGNLTAFFSTGLTSGNDTDSYNFSLGARLNW